MDLLLHAGKLLLMQKDMCCCDYWVIGNTIVMQLAQLLLHV